MSQETGEIKTTFDRELTEQIDTIAKNSLSELLWKNVSEYGILIAERDKGDSSGAVLRVMIGGQNYQEASA